MPRRVGNALLFRLARRRFLLTTLAGDPRALLYGGITHAESEAASIPLQFPQYFQIEQ